MFYDSVTGPGTTWPLFLRHEIGDIFTTDGIVKDEMFAGKYTFLSP